MVLELHDSGNPNLYAYRRIIINVNNNTGVESSKSDIIPKAFKLHQNFPNPFNSETVIEYEIPFNSFVTLKIYDILGQEIVSLVAKKQVAGKYQVKWNASSLPSGLYFYKLYAGRFKETKSMLLIR